MSISNKNIELINIGVNIEEQKILEKANLVLEESTIYTVVGPSGTGKTTLLKILAGLIPYTCGEIRQGGQIYEPKSHNIGLVPQNYGLLPWQTVKESIFTAKKISKDQKKISDKEKKELGNLLEKMGLGKYLLKYPKELSGGQQQRVAIARAFAADTSILLMDEPFSALDAFTRESMQELFLSVWVEKPQLTLFITHDIEEALLLGEKVIVMSDSCTRAVKVWDNPVYHLPGTPIEKRTGKAFFQAVKQLRGEIFTNEADH